MDVHFVNDVSNYIVLKSLEKILYCTSGNKVVVSHQQLYGENQIPENVHKILMHISSAFWGNFSWYPPFPIVCHLNN
jgi:hypothetical protein